MTHAEREVVVAAVTRKLSKLLDTVLVSKSRKLHSVMHSYTIAPQHNFEFENFRAIETTAIRQWADEEKNK